MPVTFSGCASFNHTGGMGGFILVAVVLPDPGVALRIAGEINCGGKYELWAHAVVRPQNQNHVVNVTVSCAIQEQQEISPLRGGVSRSLDCPRISYRQPPAVSVSNNISPGAPHRRAVAGEPIARSAVI